MKNRIHFLILMMGLMMTASCDQDNASNTEANAELLKADQAFSAPE